MKRPTLLLGAIAMLLAGCPRRAEPDDAALERRLASPQARARGRAAFVQHCALCHGQAADGRGERRFGLSARPVDFSQPAWRKSARPREVFRVISHGKPGTSMPAWSALDEDTRWDLVAYVLSVAEGGP